MAKMDVNAVLPMVLREDGEFTEKVDDTLIAIAMSLGINRSVMKELYRAFRRNDDEYEHQVLMGPLVKAAFDWVETRANITVGPYQKEMDMDQLLRLMGLLDSLYGEIYPLGSVVELNQEMLPPLWQELLGNDGDSMLVMITGRKQDMPGAYSKYLYDYFARPWPIGEMGQAEAIGVSNMMIDKVVFEGYSNSLEQEMADKILRASELANGQVSSAFMPNHVAISYFKDLAELNNSQD